MLSIKTVPDDVSEQSQPKVFRMTYTKKWEPYYKIPKRTSKIGLDYNGIRESLYKRDFQGQRKEISETIRKNDFYTTFQNRQQVDLRSTMRVNSPNSLMANCIASYRLILGIQSKVHQNERGRKEVCQTKGLLQGDLFIR